MRSSRITLGGFGGFGALGSSSMSAMAAGLIGRATSTGIIKSRQGLKAATERDEWNDKVDAAKRQKNMAFRTDGYVREFQFPKKTRTMPAPSNHGATVIGDLIFNYQVHSNNIMSAFTNQRALEYKRRVGGRSIDGVKAEAEHLHRARNKQQKKVSRMIGGRTLRVILQLSTHQQYKADADRTRQWQLWEPVADGIWQYQVHDEVFPYFMFNDEAGELFEFDPAKLHFSTLDDCNQAIQLYVNTLNARHGPGTSFARPSNTEALNRIEEADLAFKTFCELHGHTLTAATNTISADEAGNEGYSLEC